MAPPEHHESVPTPARSTDPVRPGGTDRVAPGGPNPVGPDAAPGPATRRDGWAWLWLAVGGFLVGQVGGAVLVELAAGVEGKTRHLSAIEVMASPPEWYIVSSLVGLWCGFGLAPLLASRLRGSGRFVADLGVRFRWIDTIGIGIGVGGQVLVAVLYAPFINHLHNFSAPTQKLTGSAHGWGFFVIALFTVVGAPFFEELYFRGLLFRALVRLFSPSDTARRTAAIVSVGPAVLLDAMLFGLAHGEAEQFAGLAVFGAILAYVSYRTGRQGMNMVAHASFNLVAVLAIVANGGGVIH